MPNADPAEAPAHRVSFYVTDEPDDARMPWSVSRAVVDVGEPVPVHGLLCRDCGTFIAAVGPAESVQPYLEIAEHHECG